MGKQSFKWHEIEQEFKRITNCKCNDKSLKNKYDSMKRDWHLWKQLNKVIGLGWDLFQEKLVAWMSDGT